MRARVSDRTALTFSLFRVKAPALERFEMALPGHIPTVAAAPAGYATASSKPAKTTR
jgi:hypothetical protein